jgi:hypothetical protein
MRADLEPRRARGVLDLGAGGALGVQGQPEEAMKRHRLAIAFVVVAVDELDRIVVAARLSLSQLARTPSRGPRRSRPEARGASRREASGARHAVTVDPTPPSARLPVLAGRISDRRSGAQWSCRRGRVLEPPSSVGVLGVMAQTTGITAVRHREGRRPPPRWAKNRRPSAWTNVSRATDWSAGDQTRRAVPDTYVNDMLTVNRSLLLGRGANPPNITFTQGMI